MKTSFALVLALAAAQLHAHDGHGLSGGHWHATDAALGIALAVAGLALWWSRK
jgi:hypothetical protein